jgi:uncharacterized protein
VETQITYFDKPGKENTDAVLEIVKKRSGELGINTIVVASYHGFTAERAVKVLDGMKIVIIGGFFESNAQNLAGSFSQGDEKLIKEKATVLIATHLFAGLNRAIRKQFDTSSPGEIIAQTLRMIGVGIKVAIECSVMAADAGLVPTDKDIFAVAGTRGGADTAIILQPVNSQDFFTLKVKEILCKPRDW